MTKLELIRKYFVNRTDVLVTKFPTFNHRGDPGDQTLIDHLEGRQRVGVHSIDPGTQSTRWVCFDFDQHVDDTGQVTGLSAPMACARKYKAKLESYGLHPYVEISGGGRGAHVWVFFDQPVEAATARQLRHVLEPEQMVDGTMSSKLEVFPKQDTIEPEGFGNLVWLPFWGQAPGGINVPLDWPGGEPFATSTVTEIETLAEFLKIKQNTAPSAAKSRAATPSVPDPLPVRMARFERLLAAPPYEARPAIEGQGGYSWSIAIFKLAMDLLTPDEAMLSTGLMDWARSCRSPWEHDEMYRKLRACEHDWTHLAYSGDQAPPDTDDDREATFDWIAEQNDNVQPPPKIEETVTDADLPPTAEQILRETYSKPKPDRAKTGIPELDTITGGGLIPGNLTFYCAPPGSGKTGFVIFQALQFEAEGTPVVLAEMELSFDETAARVAAQTTKVGCREVLEDRDPEKVAANLQAVAGKAVHVLAERPSLTQIEKAIIATKRKYGKSPVLVVDFLQQVPGSGGYQDVRTQVGGTAYALKALTEKHGCCCLVVSSVARAAYGLQESTNPKDWLAVAKESGDVEFAAGVLSVLEVGPHDPATGWSPGRLVIAKNRHGETGFVGLRFHGLSGAWRSDPTALGEFGAGGEAARKRRAVKEKIVETIRKEGQVVKSRLVNDPDFVTRQLGCSKLLANELVEELAARGVIKATEEVVVTAGGKQVAKVIRLADTGGWPAGLVANDT